MSRLQFAFVLFWLGASTAAWGYSSGADPRMTNAPGDLGTCNSCHLGTALNKGGGSVVIVMPGGKSYLPGVKQRITVEVTDSAQKRWGFELTARLNSSLSTGQAGCLAASDNTTQVFNSIGGKPSCTSTSLQFVTHTVSGTRNGTKGSITFAFDWTPPTTDVGPVTLYAAGNAANGDGTDTGDHIYTTSLELAVATAGPATAVNGVTSMASGNSGTSPGSWIAINGTSLSNTTRTWTSDESSAKLPTSLDGVTVQVDGKAAYVQSVSPTRVVALTPSDSFTGLAGITVNNNGAASQSVNATMTATAPSLLVASDQRYLLTSHGDNPLASRLDDIPSTTPPAPTSAYAGEVISFFGAGFGPVDPAMTDGVLQAAAAKITTAFTLTVGGEPAQVSFAGLAPGFAGVYQFKTTIPSDLANGDQAVVIQMGNQSTQSGKSCCYVQIAPQPKPIITSTVSAASQAAGTAPGSWIAINGSNLAKSSRAWTAAEATATTGLPATLDGVGVQVNSIAAYVQAVSPTQLLVLTPSDTTTGQINLQVTNNGQASDNATVTMASTAPALFTADGKYLVMTSGTNMLDKRLDIYPATAAWPAITWPTPGKAKPGDTVSFYGTGFGPTDTAIVDGQLQGAAVNITTPFTLTIGGETVTPAFAGLAPGFAGVFQFTVAIPTDLPNGDQPVVITMGGLSTVGTDKCCFVQVQAGSDTVQ